MGLMKLSLSDPLVEVMWILYSVGPRRVPKPYGDASRCLPPAGVLDMCDEWLAMIPVLPPGDQLVHVFEDDDYDTLIVDIDE